MRLAPGCAPFHGPPVAAGPGRCWTRSTAPPPWSRCPTATGPTAGCSIWNELAASAVATASRCRWTSRSRWGCCRWTCSASGPTFSAAPPTSGCSGPYSIGFLYASERWQAEGRPIEHNWIHRRNAEDFARLVDYQDEFEPGARRFDVGERSNFALVPAAEAGIRQILEWGVDNVRETIEAMADGIVEQVAPLGLTVLPKSERAPHYLGLQLAPGMPPDLLPELARRRVYVSVRGSSIRVTPHLYNTDADIDRLVRALKQAL